MFRKLAFGSLVLMLLYSCGQAPKPELQKEPWVDLPFEDWPTFALTNEVAFTDTTFTHLGNAFLVDTGVDTLAITCKHLFLVFNSNLGLNTIDLGEDYRSWDCYSWNNKDKKVTLDTLINGNPDEVVAAFNTLKVRDWIAFTIKKYDSNIYPLKIRHTPVKKLELVYAVGWGDLQTDIELPEKSVLQCYTNLGPYFYVRTLSNNTTPVGKSGSPVIDENGYLVGIVSGAEGKLGVIGSVNYLIEQFDKYGIAYKK